MHPGSERGRSRRSSRHSGFKDASQGISVSGPSSHDRKSVFRHGGPTARENTHRHIHTHHLRHRHCCQHTCALFFPAGNIKVTLVIYVTSLRSAGQQSAVFQRVSPLSEKRRGTSIHQALICPRIILHRCTGSVINNSIFTTLSGFFMFSHGTRRGFRTAVCKHVDQNLQPRVECSS